jgi:hypothetical protein
LHKNKLKQSRGGSRGELTSRVVVEDLRGSGKKRGMAIIVWEEEGCGHRRRGRRGVVAPGRRGAAAVVIGEEEGRGRRHPGKKGSGRRS